MVRAVLRGHAAHFTNFYGRSFTETLDPYTGPDEGDLPIQLISGTRTCVVPGLA